MSLRKCSPMLSSGIALYIYARLARRIFLDEVARGAGREVGPAVGKRIVEAMEYVRRWIKRMAQPSPVLKPKPRPRAGYQRELTENPRRRRAVGSATSSVRIRTCSLRVPQSWDHKRARPRDVLCSVFARGLKKGAYMRGMSR
jgi:hypothetical protein